MLLVDRPTVQREHGGPVPHSTLPGTGVARIMYTHFNEPNRQQAKHLTP